MRTVFALVILALMAAPGRAQVKPDWQKHCDACIGYYTADPAALSCQGDYAATYPECLTGGGRACLMVRAVAAAKSGDCEKAFKLTLICQCHDGAAQEHLKMAGKPAVCDYLKTK